MGLKEAPSVGSGLDRRKWVGAGKVGGLSVSTSLEVLQSLPGSRSDGRFWSEWPRKHVLVEITEVLVLGEDG